MPASLGWFVSLENYLILFYEYIIAIRGSISYFAADFTLKKPCSQSLTLYWHVVIDGLPFQPAYSFEQQSLHIDSDGESKPLIRSLQFYWRDVRINTMRRALVRALIVEAWRSYCSDNF